MKKIYIKCMVNGVEEFEISNKDIQYMFNMGRTVHFKLFLGGSVLELELEKK